MHTVHSYMDEIKSNSIFKANKYLKRKYEIIKIQLSKIKLKRESSKKIK